MSEKLQNCSVWAGTDKKNIMLNKHFGKANYFPCNQASQLSQSF